MGLLIKVQNTELICSTKILSFSEQNCFVVPEVDITDPSDESNTESDNGFGINDTAIGPAVGGVVSGIFGIAGIVIVPIFVFCYI